MPEPTQLPAERVIVVDLPSQAREQFLRDMKELEKHPLDEARVPGGYYLNADGSGAHDANGNPVEIKAEHKELAEDVKAQAKARATANAPAGPEDSAEEVKAAKAPATAAAKAPAK